MSLSDNDLDVLRSIATDLVLAMEDVAEAASQSLRGPDGGAESLGSQTNSFSGDGRAAKNVVAIRSGMRQHVERILREPFVNKVRFRWEDGREETIFVTRGSAAAVRGSRRKLATQATPKGRFAVLEPGDWSEFEGREFQILERVDLRPQYLERWDSYDNRILVHDGVRAVLDALRKFLEGADAEVPYDDILGALLASDEGAATVRDKLRHRVIARMSLRDQPTLDRYQDDVSRLELDHRVLLLGPPGSGKTTTLIRRLAHKRHPEGLVDDERELLATTGLTDAFSRPSGWAMFSPTDLLQLYLRDAFNREQVPAEARNLRTWDRERRDLARNVLGILRLAPDSPGFELDENAKLLKDESSPALSALHDAFVPFATDLIFSRMKSAFEDLAKTDDADVRASVEKLRSRIGLGTTPTIREVAQLMDHGATLQPQVTRLKHETDDALRKTINALLGKWNPTLIADLVAALPQLRVGATLEEDEEEDDEDDDAPEPVTRSPQREAAEILLAGLRSRGRQLASGRKKPSARVGRLLEVLGARAPSDDELLRIGRKLFLMRELRSVMRAPRSLVLRMPVSFGRFRRSQADKLFVTGMAEAIRTRRVSAAEVDVLVLAMLGLARQLLELDPRRFTGVVPDWLDKIRARYIPQVFVDEATDFSAVQLACTLELAHPRLRSWFACGDFRQRITSTGIQTEVELAWVADAAGQDDEIDRREVSIGYRQSSRLRSLATALEALHGDTPRESGPSNYEEHDVEPLLADRIGGEALAAWIAARIAEIGRTVNPLPSIAIFVDGDDRIEPLVAVLEPALSGQNLPVAACRKGRDIGDRQEIRVFDVQHIKGLEFEAVFFVGIDALATRLPDLFARFLYVGVTRAATYLAVTTDGDLPTVLEPMRTHFSAGTWGA